MSMLSIRIVLGYKEQDSWWIVTAVRSYDSQTARNQETGCCCCWCSCSKMSLRTQTLFLQFWSAVLTVLAFLLTCLLSYGWEWGFQWVSQVCQPHTNQLCLVFVRLNVTGETLLIFSSVSQIFILPLLYLTESFKIEMKAWKPKSNGRLKQT